MTPLRQRMIEDMQVGNLAPVTQSSPPASGDRHDFLVRPYQNRAATLRVHLLDGHGGWGLSKRRRVSLASRRSSSR
jgi:hypothetical protein